MSPTQHIILMAYCLGLQLGIVSTEHFKETKASQQFLEENRQYYDCLGLPVKCGKFSENMQYSEEVLNR